MYKDPRLKRLQMEHQLLDELCENSDLISYETINRQEGFPPEHYRIHFAVKSIIAINEKDEPIYHDSHVAEIKFPSGYPMTSAPICIMNTNVWHPNVRSKGEFKGRICINAQVLGTWHTLDMLTLQIGEMLQYKNYHAKQIQPYPEDAVVAKWVTQFAEPKDIVNKAKKINTDNRPLLNASKKWLETRNKKNKIKIVGFRQREVQEVIPEKKNPITTKIKIQKK